MSPDVIQQLEELPIEDISSPLTAQILDFCSDDGASAAVELFQQSDHSQQHHHLLLSSSDVSSSSPTTTATAVTPNSPFCCYPDDDASFSEFPSLDAATLSALLDSTPPPLPFPPAGSEPNLVQAAGYDCSSSSSSTAVTTATATSTNPTPTAMFPISSSFQDPFEHIMLAGAGAGGYGSYSGDQMVPAAGGGPLSHQHYQQQQMAPVAYEEDPRYADASALVQPLPGFMGLEAAAPPPLPYGFFESGGGGGMGGFYHNGGSGIGDAHGFFGGEIMIGGLGGPASDAGEYQNGGLGIYGRSDPTQQSYNSGDLQQVVAGNGQHLMTGCSSSSTTVTTTTDTSTVDESSFKVGRLSVEERKEKIHRYMKKRNERNFSKKIKYACRKTLADSRPRVRGRFAKNDESGEASRATSSNHEYDDEEEVIHHGAAKEGEDILDSSDILAHISGVNSFRYNYSLESWV